MTVVTSTCLPSSWVAGIVRTGLFLTFVVACFSNAMAVGSNERDGEGALPDRVFKGVTVPYPPYMIVEADDVSGIVTDIVRAAFQRADLKVEIRSLPMNRGLQQIRDGSADFMFTLFYTEERARYMHYARQPLSYEDIILAVPKGKKPGFDGALESLSGLEVGTPMGYSLGGNIDQAFKDGLLIKTEVPDSLAGVKMLANKRLQSMASDRLTFLFMLQASNYQDDVEIVLPPLNRTPAFIGYSQKAPDSLILRDRIDEQLKMMWEEGAMEIITKRYINN